MSLDAMRWALQQTNLRSSVKFVLVALADRANEANECFPSRDQLQLDTCLNKQTVSAATEELVRIGLLEKVRRFNGSTVYRLIGVPGRHENAPQSAGKPASRKTGSKSAGKPDISQPENRLLTYQLTTIEPKEEKVRFAAPSVSDVAAYATAHGYSVDANAFCAYYESNGWRVGRNPMKCWQKAVASWHYRNAKNHNGGTRARSLAEDLTDRSWAT